MVCNNCGTPNNPEAKFCVSCGATLDIPVADNSNVAPACEPTAAPVQEQVVFNAPVQEPIVAQNAASASVSGKGLSIASMVLGIVSIFCFPAITGVLAIIFGAVARSKGCKNGMAMAGIVCGIIGVAWWLISLIACQGAMNDILNEFMYY